MKKKIDPADPIQVPFTVLIDGREKAPYAFRGIHADVHQHSRPLAIPTKWAHLPSGDYSIDGLIHQVAVERKSMEDLFSTLGQHREQFEAEVERLSSFDSAAIIIEAPWSRILNHPPPRSRLLPKTILRTAIAWMQRYHVPWVTCEDRRLAEITTFRWLERWWIDWQEGQKNLTETMRIL